MNENSERADAEAPRWQGGMSNDELRAAFKAKLPNAEPSERDLTMFALGVEVGADNDSIEWEEYQLEGIGMVRRRKPASDVLMSEMRAEYWEWVQDRGCDTDGAWSAWQGAWNHQSRSRV
jgi:hypothetical protein